MAPEKRYSSDYFLEDSDNDVENIAWAAAEASTEDGDEDHNERMDSGGLISGSSSVVSHQWPRSFREAVDIYSISASPSFGVLRPRIGSPVINSHNFLDTHGRKPLLADHKKGHEPEEVHKMSSQSILSDKPSFYKQPSGEIPLSYGCSLVQTIFNGVNVMAGVGLLSTPYTVKEGGWASLFVLVLFAFICCYTAILMRHCFESTEGILTFPDMGEAAFGKWGRVLISVILYSELYMSCLEYLILEGDNLATIYPGMSLNICGFQIDSTHFFGTFSALIILPTLLLKDLRLISYLSASGVIATILVVLCLLFVGTTEVGFHHSGELITGEAFLSPLEYTGSATRATLFFQIFINQWLIKLNSPKHCC